MKRFLAFFLLIILFFPAFAKLDKESIELVSEIKELYKHIDELSKQPRMRIDSLKMSIDSTLGAETDFRKFERLGDEYIEIHLDSAMFYWHIAESNAIIGKHEINSKLLELKALSYKPYQGLGFEAMKTFEEFDPSDLPDSLQNHYWSCAARVYTAMLEVSSPGILKEQYRQKGIHSLDRLSKFYPEGSPISSFLISVLHYASGDEHLAVANISQLLPYFEKSSSLYEMALLRMVQYYKERPQSRQEYVKRILMLTKSSMQRGVVIPAVMAEAGKILYDEGNKSLGRSLILSAMKCKNGSIYSHIPFDHTEYIDYLYSKALTVRIWLAILFTLLVIGIVVLSCVLINLARRSKINSMMYEKEIGNLDSKNKELGKSLDSTIALSFFSNEQLREYNLYVHRKLKAGQARELYRDVDSGEYMAELYRTFFHTFDQLFMESFPDFVDRLNELLQPDRQLALLPGNHLSPELRIAAYMHFGMNDSAKLSKALGLSLNTIYTYRNRLKGRAVDKSNFEENVRNMISK